LDFSHAANSLKPLAGIIFLAKITNEAVNTSEMGAKSFNTLY
jgi:hypothetical protein